MLAALTPLASPITAPPRVARTRTTCVIAGYMPSVPLFKVAVPCVPGNGVRATEPKSVAIWSRLLPLGLLNGL